MATATGEGLVVSIAEPVHENEVSDPTLVARGLSLAKPLGPASGKELVTAAIEEGRERGGAFEAQGTQRWHALDQLLRTSFGMVSPAYLFTSFPKIP